jgi:hypothetical protein
MNNVVVRGEGNSLTTRFPYDSLIQLLWNEPNEVSVLLTRTIFTRALTTKPHRRTALHRRTELQRSVLPVMGPSVHAVRRKSNAKSSASFCRLYRETRFGRLKRRIFRLCGFELTCYTI